MIDTNILIAHAYRPESASGRIVEACLDGRLVAVVSPALLDEYHFILPRAVHRPGWRTAFEAFLEVVVMVEPGETPRVVEADPSDDMLFAAALEGEASVVISNDAEVLRVGTYRAVEVKRPSVFVLDGGLTS